jgi:peptide/nickel transport system substrate-binding protein
MVSLSTADDVLFYWEHMLIPGTFGKQLYDCYYSVDPKTGERVRGDVAKVDNYTVKITFKYSHPLFLKRLAIDNKWFFAPAHFYKTILPEFVGAAKALEIAKKWGYEDLASFGQWTGYYYWVFPERPTLRAWVAKNDPRGERFIMERNAYYWKTDAEGKQLPYMDRIVVDKVADQSHYLLKTLAGEINLKQFTDFTNFTVLKENENKGKFRVLRWSSAFWSSTGLQLNLSIENEQYRKLFQDIRFREALSVAVDRNQVSQIVTNGLADPQQASVPEGLPNYQKGWGDQWTQFDQNRAKKLFDEIGLKWDGNKQYRTFADGSEINLIIYHEDTGETNKEKLQELLKNYFEQVGIKT